MNSPPQALPYLDTKPVGAAGFYTAINATFRFILGRFGKEGLLRYWEDIGSRYYRPVTERWSAGGLPAVAEYWRAFFVAEPGAEVEVQELGEHVEVKIVDPQTNDIVPVNTPGEICTRGYNTMLGYWNQPDKTSEIISEDGWIRSG